MRAPRSPAVALADARAALLTLVVTLIVIPSTVSATMDSTVPLNEDVTRKIELVDGVSMKFPDQGNATDKMVSFEIDTKRSLFAGRGAGKQTNLLQRILPLFIMPFLIQSTIVPFFLSTLKFMLFKSVMVGKIALALIIFNAFRNHNTFKGQQDDVVANVHYGYHGDGMDEYGAYVN